MKNNPVCNVCSSHMVPFEISSLFCACSYVCPNCWNVEKKIVPVDAHKIC